MSQPWKLSSAIDFQPFERVQIAARSWSTGPYSVSTGFVSVPPTTRPSPDTAPMNPTPSMFSMPRCLLQIQYGDWNGPYRPTTRLPSSERSSGSEYGR